MQRQTYICAVAKGTIHHCERDETEDERLDGRDVILETENQITQCFITLHFHQMNAFYFFTFESLAGITLHRGLS